MYKLLLLALISLILTQGVQSENDVNDKPTSDLKDGPIHIDIVGDTSHLFADEDFEKKEAVFLGNDESLGTSQKPNYIDILRGTLNITSNASNENPNRKSNKCTRSSVSRDLNSVQLVNGSVLTQHLSDTKETECFLVLFYVPWCPFSVRLAPTYNALPRAFTDFDVLAFDVSKSIGYNSKFGTSSVPMIILFQHKNILSRFNYTSKGLADYIDFVANRTSFKANRSISIEVADLEGPVPTVVQTRFDYALLMSWLLVIFVAIDLLVRKTELKVHVIRLAKYMFTDTRQRQLGQGPQRHMIQNVEQHPHND